MESVIITDALTKRYGTKTVVNELDLSVPEGSIYGFLGPNGAGKSTTMKLLLGLVKPSRGQMILLGHAVTPQNRLAILKDTGSLIEAPAYYGHLSGKENLKIICTLKNVPESEIDRVLKIVRMENQKDKKVRQYSLGMKQRLGLAASLLGAPKLLLLDEPTNGLDPAGIQEMRELIRSLPREYGITVLVSSHLLAEIDHMATHVGIIDKGQLIFQDSLARLHEHSQPRILLRTTNDQAAACILQQAGIPASLEKSGSPVEDAKSADSSSTPGNRELYLQSCKDRLVLQAVTLLVKQNIGILRVTEQQISLEDIFLQLTGRQVGL